MDVVKHPERKELRSFGLVVGIIFAFIGVKPMVTLAGWAPEASPRSWAIVGGGALILLAVVMPRALVHPYRAWMRIGAALGWLNMRILLTLVYFGLVTPLGMLQRILGRETLARRRNETADSYRSIRPHDAPLDLSQPF